MLHIDGELVDRKQFRFPGSERMGVFFKSNPTVEVFKFQLDSNINWDSTLVSFLHKCRNDLAEVNKSIDFQALPSGLIQLLELSKPTLLEKKQNEFSLSLELIDDTINYFRDATLSIFSFFGEWISSVVLLFTGRSQTRFQDFRCFLSCLWCLCLAHCYLNQFFNGINYGICGQCPVGEI